MRRILLALACLALLVPASSCGGGSGGGGSTVPANCGCQVAMVMTLPGSTPGTAMTAAEVALIEEVFAQVNAERQDRGLGALTWHQGAAVVAYDHSIDMANNDVLTHDGPAPCAGPTDCLLQRLQTGGVMGFSAWGENVARGQMTAQEVMCGPVSWMLSAGHCANILDPNFTHVGMGVRLAGASGPYWTQVFLRIP